MREGEPRKETIGQGELYFLWHPGSEDIFSGYGITTQPGSQEFLIGLLIIDRPTPANPAWLDAVEETFGPYQLEAMTVSGERGIACQMQIAPDSLLHLRQFPGAVPAAIQKALEPLLKHPPHPAFVLRWDEDNRLWRSEFARPAYQLPAEIREVFERTGYGCLAAEADIGIVHICHASDADIEGFANKPVWYRWQLIEMPTAPLIRLEMVIPDRLDDPFRFESFLSVAEQTQAQVLAQLANQDRLYVAFYGDGLEYRFTKIIEHDRQRWQYLDELVDEAERYWNRIPPEKRDFDQAKDEFLRKYPDGVKRDDLQVHELPRRHDCGCSKCWHSLVQRSALRGPADI